MSCIPVPLPPAGLPNAPFVLKQGRTFRLVVTAFDRNGSRVDLDNPARTGRAQLRKQATDLGLPVATLSVAIRDQTIYKGKADVTLGATVSAATANPVILTGVYVLDVEFVNDVDPDDVIASDVVYVQVVAEVTK